jgi:acetyl esterase
MERRRGAGDAIRALLSCTIGLSIPAGDRACSAALMTLQRVADLRLRGPAGPARTRVWWPVTDDPGPADGLLLFFADVRPGAEDPTEWLRELASRARIVVVAAPCSPDGEGAVCATDADAITALEWAAEHAGELEADAARLFVGGSGHGAGLAARVVTRAGARGWPEVAQLIMLGVEPPAVVAPAAAVGA